jgi:hypothetical protein
MTTSGGVVPHKATDKVGGSLLPGQTPLNPNIGSTLRDDLHRFPAD